jgi:aerobic-type carbon monoxide dehydrogenase small subunit (CoxS/CutS family)
MLGWDSARRVPVSYHGRIGPVDGGAMAGERERKSAATDLTRRDFLEGSAAALAAAGATPALLGAEGSGDVADEAAGHALREQAQAVPRTPITLTVNGTEHRLEVEDRWTLNELLRDHLDLTGSKIGCNRGECGACTVLLDGEPVYSCSTLAVWADGRTVRTVEGLDRDGEVSFLQQAFIDFNAPQCGFCTPGQLMAATALLERTPYPNADEVRAALAGNLCRCSNYNAIVEAVLAAAGTLPYGGIQ